MRLTIMQANPIKVTISRGCLNTTRSTIKPKQTYKISSQETILEAAQRELKEEAGITALNPFFLGTIL